MTIVSSLNRLSQIIHQHFEAQGFHPESETLNHYIANTCSNIHSEVSEFWEAHRKGTLNEPCDKKGCNLTNAEEELADIIIRVVDTAARLKINIGHAVNMKQQYNLTRAFRHGDKNA